MSQSTKSYWQARKSPAMAMLLIALLSLSAVGAVEHFRTEPSADISQRKLAAATLASRAMSAVKAERLERGIAIDPVTDPPQSGLIGTVMSPVTSNSGHLPAKQTTVNPNFAAVVVEMLHDAGVQPGDTVAVGLSGSFPAMNLNVCAALEAMDVQPVVISSTSASQWGANHRELLWIDMEQALFDRKLIGFHSVAASLGGIDDRGVGLSEEGMTILKQAIERHRLELIEPENLVDSVNRRMAVYRQHADGQVIAAYVNVGGGTASVGTHVGKKMFRPGVNWDVPPGELPVDSVMARFAGQDVPVIHLTQIDKLATHYGLPLQPIEMPTVSKATTQLSHDYNPWLAGGLLAMIVAALAATAWQHGAIRVVDTPRREKVRAAHEDELVAL